MTWQWYKFICLLILLLIICVASSVPDLPRITVWTSLLTLLASLTQKRGEWVMAVVGVSLFCYSVSHMAVLLGTKWQGSMATVTSFQLLTDFSSHILNLAGSPAAIRNVTLFVFHCQPTCVPLSSPSASQLRAGSQWAPPCGIPCSFLCVCLSFLFSLLHPQCHLLFSLDKLFAVPQMSGSCSLNLALSVCYL